MFAARSRLLSPQLDSPYVRVRQRTPVTTRRIILFARLPSRLHRGPGESRRISHAREDAGPQTSRAPRGLILNYYIKYGSTDETAQMLEALYASARADARESEEQLGIGLVASAGSGSGATTTTRFTETTSAAILARAREDGMAVHKVETLQLLVGGTGATGLVGASLTSAAVNKNHLKGAPLYAEPADREMSWPRLERAVMDLDARFQRVSSFKKPNARDLIKATEVAGRIQQRHHNSVMDPQTPPGMVYKPHGSTQQPHPICAADRVRVSAQMSVTPVPSCSSLACSPLMMMLMMMMTILPNRATSTSCGLSHRRRHMVSSCNYSLAARSVHWPRRTRHC